MPIRRIQIILLLIFLAACLPTPSPVFYSPWAYTDLRWLGLGDAPNPTQDVIAAYTRFVGPELQIRLDFLKLAPQPDFDLYLAIGSGAAGTRSLPLSAQAAQPWTTLLDIPANGPLQALDATGGVQPRSALRVVRDPSLDTLTVSVSRAALGGLSLGAEVQVFVTPPGARQVTDQSDPFRSDTTPPPPAQALFAFWDTLPAYTSAQALRRWDGAHTGPLGGRHGLYNLLRSARNAGEPLVLLDLKAPAALSPLDFVTGLGLVRTMQSEGSLILPETVPGLPAAPLTETVSTAAASLPATIPAWAVERAMAENRRVDSLFNLTPSPYLYAPAGLDPATIIDPATHLLFTLAPSEPGASEGAPITTVTRWRDRLLISLPDNPPQEPQVTLDGPSLAARRDLLRAARLRRESGRPAFALLGGALPASTWGNPQIARAALQYLAGHPWVHFLSGADLLAANPGNAYTQLTTTFSTEPAQSGALAPATASVPAISTLPDGFLQALEQAPHNPLGVAAWQAYRALYNPVYPAPNALAELRHAYAGEVAVLLAAAQWAENPVEQAGCATDLDLDGRDECILASDQIYTVFQPESGTLSYAFARTASGAHQWIAPSSQFITGYSEASTWDLSQGLSADPAVIPGAFAPAPAFAPPLAPGQAFQAAVQPGELAFTSPDGQVKKTFRLDGKRMLVDYHATQPVQVQIPLALDPWMRFSHGWQERYQGSTADGGWFWQVGPGLRVLVTTTGQLNIQTSKDSHTLLGSEEDPNRDYPAGHFLVLPLAVAEVSAMGDFTVQFELLEAEDIPGQ